MKVQKEDFFFNYMKIIVSKYFPEKFQNSTKAQIKNSKHVTNTKKVHEKNFENKKVRNFEKN